MKTRHHSAFAEYPVKPWEKLNSPAAASFRRTRRTVTKALGIAATVVVGLFAASIGHAAQKVAIKDKTLVSWVSVQDLDCRGGSAITIGVGNQWDGLVFGERVPHKWMAGSEFWRRTPGQEELAKGEDAAPNRMTQIALVHRGSDATLLHDGKEIASWKLEKELPVYGKDAYILFGWRHLGCPGDNAYFQGSIRDARIYDHPLTAVELAALRPGEKGDVQPVAWWDFAKGTQDQMGVFNSCELRGNARIDGGQLHLKGKGDYFACTHTRSNLKRIQFRPTVGVFADPIPFFWKGRYHVFYLRGAAGPCNWYHIYSDNLLDWTEYPNPTIAVDGARDSWDGGAMFTGTVIEHGGRFYCFYTGDNWGNPLGTEGVRCATSDDLVVWKKQPDFLVVPDGKIYYEGTFSVEKNTKIRDFRDPFPYKIEGRDEWRMILCAQSADKKGVAGVFTSNDLKQWTPAAPLNADGQECPDLFKIGDTYYLIGGDHYSSSKDLKDRFVPPPHRVIDRPGIYAGKRMFDGNRHVWVGWIADSKNLIDGKEQEWGGTMCSPRELVPGPDGILYVRPVKEVIDAYSKPVLDLKSAKSQFAAAQWTVNAGQMTNKATPARATFDVPTDGMLEMTLKISSNAEVTIAFRTDDSGKQEGYLYTLTPSKGTVITHGQGIDWKRDNVRMITEKSVTVRAILLGQSIEFFVNDQYAFTRTAYDLAEGKLGLQVTKGSVTLEKLSFKQLSPKRPKAPAPDMAEVKYGPHEKNRLDFWKAKSVKPTPLMVHIHGGGFYSGDKAELLDGGLLQTCLKMDISVANINYRFSTDAPFPAPMLDGARAIQFLRLHAAEYNIDPKRIAASGGSAGAGMSLWIGFHKDLADPRNDDPVLRQSSRLSCMFVGGAQCSYDPRWVKEHIPGHAWEHPAIVKLYGLKQEEADTPRAHKLYDEASAITFVSKDSPPVFLGYSDQDSRPLSQDATAGEGIHSMQFGLLLKEKMDCLGIECIVYHPAGAAAIPPDKRPNLDDFLMRNLVKDGNLSNKQ